MRLMISCGRYLLPLSFIHPSKFHLEGGLTDNEIHQTAWTSASSSFSQPRATQSLLKALFFSLSNPSQKGKTCAIRIHIQC